MLRLRTVSIGVVLLALAIAVAQNKGFVQREHLQQVLQQPAVATAVARLRSLPLVGPLLPDPASCACTADADAAGEQAACNLSGNVTDCCCTYAAVERVNLNEVKPLVGDLVKTPFFRYFKVDLYCECPLWPDDGMCSLRDCSVCECEEHEIPEPWRKAEAVEACDSVQLESNVDRTLAPHVKASLLSVRDWRGYRNPWMPEGDDKVEYSYINLLRNSERYTGYKGEHAARVWGAIYSQDMFRGVNEDGAPPEQRVFYRLISGMHSSMSWLVPGQRRHFLVTMALTKVQKGSAYFSRYQVKYKRRRAGKTDYRARLRLSTQDKNKYNTPKYRLVVRFTNRTVVCQVAYATMAGDKVICAAYSSELPRYGLKVGLTNYAAAYCTGLLLARRVLQKLGLDKAYEGNTEDVGEDYNVDANDEGPRPFQCILDAGLKRTSTGSKVFAALKGALDGGLDIPHNEKRFVGYDPDSKEFDPEILRKYIYGGHVGEYMEEMQEEDPEKYTAHFAAYLQAGVEADELEDLYTKVHDAIRADPAAKPKARSKPAEAKRWKEVKLTYEQRKDKLKAKLSELMAGDDE